MADILRVAKERREALVAEIARLDGFIRMAEALAQDAESDVDSQKDLKADLDVHPGRDRLPLVVDGAHCKAADYSHTTPDSHVAAVSAEAPRLLLPHYADNAGSADKGVEAKAGGAVTPAREPREVRSPVGSYMEALRGRIERHFGNARKATAPVLPEPGSTSRNRGLGNAALAGPRSRESDGATVPRPSAFLEALRARIERLFETGENLPAPIAAYAESSSGRPGFEGALTNAHTAAPQPAALFSSSDFPAQRKRQSPKARRTAVDKPLRERTGSMGDSVGSVEQLRERDEPTAPPFDLHLGEKLRQRRWMLGMSRKQLGQRLGVERQQIENYETGAEHIDAARLWTIAAALEVPVAFFFEGLEGQAPETGEARGELLSDEEALLCGGAFSDDTFIFSSSRSA